MDTQLHNIRAAYAELERRVQIALRTQVGDATRLRALRSEVLALRASSDQVQSFQCYASLSIIFS